MVPPFVVAGDVRTHCGQLPSAFPEARAGGSVARAPGAEWWCIDVHAEGGAAARVHDRVHPGGGDDDRVAGANRARRQRTGGAEIAVLLDERAAQHAERAGRARVVVQLEPAAATPRDQPRVVVRAAREPAPGPPAGLRLEAAAVDPGVDREPPGEAEKVGD